MQANQLLNNQRIRSCIFPWTRSKPCIQLLTCDWILDCDIHAFPFWTDLFYRHFGLSILTNLKWRLVFIRDYRGIVNIMLKYTLGSRGVDITWSYIYYLLKSVSNYNWIVGVLVTNIWTRSTNQQRFKECSTRGDWLVLHV